jgi:hypothetical protein
LGRQGRQSSASLTALWRRLAPIAAIRCGWPGREPERVPAGRGAVHCGAELGRR